MYQQNYLIILLMILKQNPFLGTTRICHLNYIRRICNHCGNSHFIYDNIFFRRAEIVKILQFTIHSFIFPFLEEKVPTFNYSADILIPYPAIWKILVQTLSLPGERCFLFAFIAVLSSWVF